MSPVPLPAPFSPYLSSDVKQINEYRNSYHLFYRDRPAIETARTTDRAIEAARTTDRAIEVIMCRSRRKLI